MHFGAHIYLWTEKWSDRELGLFERARGLGLDSLELALGDDVKFSVATTRKAASSAGMNIVTSPGGAWPAAADLSDDDPANRRSALAFHQGIIDQSGELGAMAYAGAMYGRPGKSLRRRPPADELARTAEGLHALAAHAASAGVKLVLEPMSRFRTHVINTPEQALRSIRMADHPNLFVLLDTYHLVTEVRDYGQALRSVGDRLWGLHACENDRGVPGAGLLPWTEIFGALASTKAEYIAFETYNTRIGDFGYERGLFHNVCPDGDAFVTAALAFTRRQLAQA